MTTPQNLSDSALLRLPQVVGDQKRGIAPLVPVCKSTWWQWVREGKAPKPVRIGPRCVAWRASEIRVFLDGLKA
ncbi:helix-turn-helix transcriptional regulator [Desulfovibrio sp. TomC]|uniref:helix-turn-helix transcriptional regulator n=1 Tax=Desulfovibrio sp. TomC TaxID=1562888 RepID=UPI0009E5C031|nr:AlpA family phage regulatory protein [Desulfovibrio sp. TomC]